MATSIAAHFHEDRLSITFYPAGYALNGINVSVRLSREEVAELLRAIDEAIPDSEEADLRRSAVA